MQTLEDIVKSNYEGATIVENHSTEKIEYCRFLHNSTLYVAERFNGVNRVTFYQFDRVVNL